MADEWLWAFGDGMTSTLASPVYTYTQGGVYTVTQWVTDTATGEADVLTRTDFITVAKGTRDLVTTTMAYDYDRLYRLITATYSSGEVYTYTYDAVGNRLAMGADGELITYTYDAGDSWSPAKLLTWVDDVEYTWDDGDQRSHGNLLDNGVFSYTYNRGDHRSPANRLVGVQNVTTTVVYTYNGGGHRMAKAVDGVTTTYVVAVLGLSQVLVETTGGESVVYLYGHDLLAEEGGSGWAWHLDDGLGSVRQLADADGKVTLAQGYTPFGVPLWDAGSGTTGYGFTGERWEAYSQLLFLRARYYEPETGRFVSKDTWESNPDRPISYHAWLYGYANPTRWADRTGHSPQVECGNMPAYLNLRQLCDIGNGDDDDPAVLDAREEIFRIFAKGGRIFGLIDEGYLWGSKMLEHFLDGNAAPKNIVFSVYNEFPHDPGITRATKEKRPPIVPSDEPLSIQPLLHEFVYNHIQSAASSSTDFKVGPVFLRGKDYYVPKGQQPRPYSTGFWAAFGHVVINGWLAADVHQSCTYDGYFAEYTADYRIDDYYGWSPGKLTPFTLPLAPGTVYIPHEWELSLANASPPRAHMYDFSISWTEQEYIFVRGDFSHFRELEWWEWEGGFRSP